MSTPHARNIVRRLLGAKEKLRSQELYKLGITEYPATPFPRPPPPKQYPGRNGTLKPAPPQPPNPTHPFRSHSYLKEVVLPELVASGEIEKYHTVQNNTGETQTKKRITKSKSAINGGGQDVWFWRLKGPQAQEPEPREEKEPVVDRVGWYMQNQLFPPVKGTAEVKGMKRDPYGAGRWDHLNKRRQNGRPEKLQLEREWVRSIAAARKEGAQGSERKRS